MGIGRRVDVGQQTGNEAPQTREGPVAVAGQVLAERYAWSEKELLENKGAWLASKWNIVFYKDGKHDEFTQTHRESELLKDKNTSFLIRAAKVTAKAARYVIAGSNNDSKLDVISYSHGKHECEVVFKKYIGSSSIPYAIRVKIQFDLELEAVQQLFSNANVQKITDVNIANRVKVQLDKDLEDIILRMPAQELKSAIDSKDIAWAKKIFEKTYKFYALNIIALRDETSVYIMRKEAGRKEYSLKDICRKIDKGDFDDALGILEDERKTPNIESNERYEASGVIKAFIALSQGALDEVNVDEIGSYNSISNKYVKAITAYHKSLSEAKKALLEKNLAQALGLYSSVASGTMNNIDLGVGGMLFARNRQELIEAAQIVADKVAVVSEKDNEDLNKKLGLLNKQDFSKADLVVIKNLANGAQDILAARNFESSGDIAKAVESYKSAMSLYNFANINKNHLAALNDANLAIDFLSNKNIQAAVDSVKEAYEKIKSDNICFLKNGLEYLLDVKNDISRANIKQALADCEAATEKLKNIKNIPEWVYAQQAQLSDAVRFDELLETDLSAAKDLLERMKSFDIFSGMKIISDYKKVIAELELATDYLNNGNFSIAISHATEALSKAKNSTKINNIKAGLEKLIEAQASEEKDDVAAAIDLYQSAIAKLKAVSEVSKGHRGIEERKNALDSITEVDNYIKIGSLSKASEELKKASVASLDERILKSRKDLIQFVGQAQEALAKKDTDSAKEFLQIANNKRETAYVSKLLSALEKIDEARLDATTGKYDDAMQIYYDLRTARDVGAIAKDGIGEISRLKKQAADKEKSNDTGKLKNEIDREREGRERALSEKQRVQDELNMVRSEKEIERAEKERLQRLEEDRQRLVPTFPQKPEPAKSDMALQNGHAMFGPAETPAPITPQAPQELLTSKTMDVLERAEPRPEDSGYDLVVRKGRSLEERASGLALPSEAEQHSNVFAGNTKLTQIEELLFVGKYSHIVQLESSFKEQINQDKKLRELFILARAGNFADEALTLNVKAREMIDNADLYEEGAVVAKIQGRVKDAKAKIAASDRMKSEAEQLTRARAEKIDSARKLIDNINTMGLTGRRAQIVNNIKSMMAGDE